MLFLVLFILAILTYFDNIILSTFFLSSHRFKAYKLGHISRAHLKHDLALEYTKITLCGASLPYRQYQDSAKNKTIVRLFKFV